MKKKNPLGLRVLSTAAVMSIITSIAAPAFAGTYYMDNGNVDVEVKENGDVYVNGQKDEDGEVTIKGGSGTNTWSNKSSTNAEKQKAEEPQEEPSIGESYPVEEKTEEEPAAEEPEAEPKEETGEQPEEPENPAEDEQPEPEAPAAEEKTPAEDAAEPEETPDEDTEETDDTEETEEEDTEPAAEEETSAEDAEQSEETADNETAPAEQEAVTLEAAGEGTAVQSEDETPAETPNTISIKNDWKTNLKIILDNVRIKASGSKAAMSVTGKESTTVELDGANVLDSSGTSGHAGLEKSGAGTLTITDTDGTTDNDGSLTATGGNGGAGIGGKRSSNGERITIEGNAKVTAVGGEDAAGIGGGSVGDGRDITIQGNADVKAAARGYGAGIGGGIMDTSGHGGNADKIVIRGNAKVNASSVNGAGIGSGGAAFGGQANATGIVIRDHAEVTAEATGYGSGIGVGDSIYNAKTDITIGTEGATSADEDVHVTAKSRYNSAIGGGTGGDTADTTVTIQGNATIEEAKSQAESSSNVLAKAAIGGTSGTVNVTIRDNAKIKKVDHTNERGKAFEIAIGGGSKTTKVIVNILGHAHLESVLGDIEGGKNAIINIKDHAAIDSIRVDSGWAIGGWVGSGNSSIVNIDGGPDGNVRIGEVGGICGNNSGIKGTSVNIGDHVKLWLKQGNGTNSTYVEVDRKEVDVGSTQKPEAGGLINTIGSDTEIWYTDKDGTLVQIVHGENLCKTEGKIELDRVNPTCEEDGYVEYKCGYEAAKSASTPCCDRTWKEVLPATGHSWNEGEVTTAPTCTEAGVKTYTCTTCSKTRTETIPATGHNWVKGEHHDANCMKGGYDDYTCSGCGATKEEPDGTTPNNDHDYSGEEWDEITNATCTTDGKKVKHCKRPGADATHDKTEVIKATGHQHVTEGVGKKDPTCKEPGYTGDTVCDDCHETIKKGEVIPATGHEKTHIEGKKEPTCEEPGYTGDKVCDKCGDMVEKGEVIPAKGHTPTVVGKKDPTETEPGYTGDTVCADCGKLLEKGEVIPATGKKDDENAEVLELRVVVPGNTLRDLLFTVRQAGTERTYTCKKADATLTGTLETLQYLQANGAETIVFVTNGRVSRFAVADLLALCDEGDVFYLCHTADAEPTLLIIANDHTELLNK